MPQHDRPTSPHLTVYRPQITSVLSIFHRITGVALFAGTALMMAWLWVIAYAPSYYPQLMECLHSLIGQAALWGWAAAFYYHLANGIRHLFWDMGKGFAVADVEKSGWMVLILTAIMLALTWSAVYSSAG